MDTKLKGWTAVRIVCLVLIPALCFAALNRALASLIRADETGVHPQVIFTDLSTNQYFYQHNMREVNRHAAIVAYFGSEEAIMAGAHLTWFNYTNRIVYQSNFNDNILAHIENWSELRTHDENYLYGTIDGFTQDSTQARRRIEESAKQQQLSSFRYSLRYLENAEGLLFSISNEGTAEAYASKHIELQDTVYIGDSHFDYDYDYNHDYSYNGIIESAEELFGRSIIGRNFTIESHNESDISRASTIEINSSISNVPNINDQFNRNFFRSHPVFYMVSYDDFQEQSGSSSYGYSHVAISQGAKQTIYLAFTSEFVAAQNHIIASVSNAYLRDLIIISISALLVIGMIVVLLVGAGRVNRLVDGEVIKSESVHFSPVDKPYWDFSLALVAGWTVLIIFLGYIIAESVSRVGISRIWNADGTLLTSWNNNTIITFNIIIAVATVLIVPPVLFWLMGFVKRLKAGGFWKHTLVYAIVYSCLFGSIRFIARKLKAMWAGTRLMLKVTSISIAVFCWTFFVAIVAAESRNLGVALLVVLVLTGLTALLLTLYARRIRALELGARAVSEGSYKAPIFAGGGELGSIAGSINNISAGINTAVEERMKSERLKTELITNVSHDIRTPLTSIITYTDLLESEGLDCERAHDYLDVLKQKSLRLKTLTDELFEAAKASTGNIDVNLTELNVVSLINQVLGELDNSIKSSGLDLRVALPDSLMARADGRLMQRVLENLLSNVFKYSLPSSRVYLDAFADGADVRISLKNISSQELNFDPSELTERFKRGDDSRADGGNGLGLSIVQSFVEAQGGSFAISIDGDLFKATVTLPSP